MPPKHTRRTSPPPAPLLRCVRSPDSRLLADFLGKLPCSNPLWLGTQPDVLHRVAHSDLASCWFGAPTASGDAFLKQCASSCERAVLETIAIAHKSGAVVLGLDGVMQALDAEALRVVIIAEDAGASDQKRLRYHPEAASRCFHFGSRSQLGRLFGRHAQVFLGLTHGELAEKCAFFLQCNSRFRCKIGL
jgi:ribosomal protein L30E